MAASQVINPFGPATGLGEGLAKTFDAFLRAPTPEQRAKSALDIYGLQAQGKRDLAAAGYDDARTAGQNISNQALGRLPTLDFESPEAQGVVMQTMNGSYSSLADPFVVALARRPNADIRSMDPMAYAKTGNAAHTFTGFDADQQRQRDKAALDATTARYGHDLDYRGKVYDVDQTQSGLDRRATVNAGAGDTVYTAPGGLWGGKTFSGAPTQDTVHGQLATDFLSGGGDPNATLSPQTPLGAAFDTKNPNSGGMTLSVGPDGTVQMTQGGSGAQVPTSTVSNNLQTQQSIESFIRTMGDLRSVAGADPTIFGTAGNVRRLAQGVAQQFGAFKQALGGGDFEDAFTEAAVDLSQAGLQDPRIFDPNLTDVEKMAVLAAYQAAGALAAQEGRGLSDNDFLRFRQVIGDPTAWLSSQAAFMAGLNRVERLALAELNASRRRLGMPPVDPAAFSGAPATNQGAADNPPVPPALQGRNLLWSPSRQQFRDATTGEVFNADGRQVQ